MNKSIISKYIAVLCYVFFLHTSICKADEIVIFTNKTAYVAGEQVQFDLVRRKKGVELYKSDPYLVSIDLVKPSGEILDTKTLYKDKDNGLFFRLSQEISTGVYRLIVNSNACKQVVRRIHIYGKAIEQSSYDQKIPNEIQVAVHGNQLIKGIESALVLRVMDENKAGIKMTGTLLNSSDSVINYLRTDANGLVRLNFTPRDSLYKVEFGGVSKKIFPKNDNGISTSFNQNSSSIEVMISGSIKDVQVAIDGVLLDVDTNDILNFSIDVQDLKEGIHNFQVMKNHQEIQRWVFFKESNSKVMKLNEQQVKVNSEVKTKLSINTKYSKSMTSIIDSKYPFVNSFDFYRSLYFDQYDLNIQWVEDRDFIAYLIYFHEKLETTINNERLKLQTHMGVLKFREESPNGLLSILPINTLEPIEIRGEFIEGLHSFQNEMTISSSSVFVYELSNFLRPLKPFDYRESIYYKYDPLNIHLEIDQKSINLVSDFCALELIHDSYAENINDSVQLPKADFIYDLNDFDVPDTLEELINQIVKYIVVKRRGRLPYLSLYRYMTMYKFEGEPLILINDLPTFDLELLLKIDPKGVERVELRNSIASTVTFGNMGMNGAICFYLKSNIENPLQAVAAKMPVLEKGIDYKKKEVSSEHAPDFRSQLYWGMDSYENSVVSDSKTTTTAEGSITTTNTHMILHTNSSSLKSNYQVISYLIKENGEVVKLKSQLRIN